MQAHEQGQGSKSRVGRSARWIPGPARSLNTKNERKHNGFIIMKSPGTGGNVICPKMDNALFLLKRRERGRKCYDGLVVRTLRCGRRASSSNPGHGNGFFWVAITMGKYGVMGRQGLLSSFKSTVNGAEIKSTNAKAA